MSVKISPSVLTADFLTLKDDIKKLEAAGTDMLHLDVMDGIFVPNISFGVPVIKSIKKHTSLPLDVHLMIDRPHRYISSLPRPRIFWAFITRRAAMCVRLLPKSGSAAAGLVLQ